MWRGGQPQSSQTGAASRQARYPPASGIRSIRTEVLGIGSDGEQRLGRSAEQQVVDHRLVLVGDWSDLGWQREDQTVSITCLMGSEL